MAIRKFPMSSFYMEDDAVTLTPHASGLSVYEEGESIVIEAALPGLSSENIEVSHSHGYLLIEGEKVEEEKQRKYYRKASNTFSYCVPIPASADMSVEPEAIFKDGIMKISFKKGVKKGKPIPIKTHQ